jgi:dipeptidyl aminopeptidase/acylaminoacyl peptidase
LNLHDDPVTFVVVLKSLATALVLLVLLAFPAAAGAVLAGTNGRIALIQGPAFGNTQLYLRTVTSSTGAGSIAGPLATGLTMQHRHPTWSPDRTKIAFAEGPGGATGYDIYTFDLTTPGATPQDITNSSGVTDDRPAWSPDGTRIAYESGNDIMVHALSGGSDLNLTTTLTPKAWKAAWSPDSQTLYYSVGDITLAPNGTNNDIRLYQQPANNSSAGTELLHVSGAHVFQPSISPDGTKLCYTISTAAGNSTTADVVAASLSDPSTVTVIAGTELGDYNCTWSPDGSKIAYTEDYAGNGEIDMKNSDGSGNPTDLTNTPGVFDGNADWAPDGRPTCPNSTATTTVNTPVTITVTCNDTGPAYEQSDVKEFKSVEPNHGTIQQEFAGEPFVYTPDKDFSGTDSFVVGSFDEFGFGSESGTVTISVRTPAPPPKGKGSPKGKGGASAFGAKTLVALGLAARRIPAGGPLKILVTNRNGFAITGKLSGRKTRKASTSKLKTKAFGVGARAKTRVKMRLPKALRRVLRRKHKLTLALNASVRDPAGDIRIVSRTVTPKLKK